MSIVEISVVVVVATVGFWFLYKTFKVAEEGKQLREQEDFNAPYKVEPNETLSKYDFSPHVVAVSEEYNKDQPAPRAKRAYNKTSKYWTKKRKAKSTKRPKRKNRPIIL